MGHCLVAFLVLSLVLTLALCLTLLGKVLFFAKGSMSKLQLQLTYIIISYKVFEILPYLRYLYLTLRNPPLTSRLPFRGEGSYHRRLYLSR